MERLFEKPPCDTCKQLKGASWDEADCKECLPDSLPENEDAIKIYGIVCKQLIMGFNGPIDINHLPIYKAMDLHEIEDQKGCFEKVLKLSKHFLEK